MPPSNRVDECYLENKQGNHNKFYEVWIERVANTQSPFALMTRWGRIGTDGTTKLKKSYSYEGAAHNAFEVLRTTKLQKGYSAVALPTKAKVIKRVLKKQIRKAEPTGDPDLDRFSAIL